MPKNSESEEVYHDENTLRKVYEGLLAAGVYGQQAVDAVNQMQNQGILFRERVKPRRGRPPKIKERRIDEPEESKEEVKLTDEVEKDAWTPLGG